MQRQKDLLGVEVYWYYSTTGNIVLVSTGKLNAFIYKY